MFIMDMPYVPAQETPIVLVQAATPAVPQPDYLLKYCAEKASTGGTRYVMNSVDPAGGLKNYLENRDNHYIDITAIKITLLEGTKHGELVPGKFAFMYEPTEGYVGKDKAIFMAEFEGKRYKIIVELHVFDVAPMESLPSSCPPPQLIKVNGKPVSGSTGYDSGYSFGSLSVTFADLAGGAVGQATGEGANATITLDTTAANRQWFLGSNIYPTN
jgi:hypothetical protein